MSLKNCKLITLPKMGDERGMLSFAENKKHVPFEIKRVFYSYDVPEMNWHMRHTVVHREHHFKFIAKRSCADDK